ncbi:hypothetical protein QFZ49_001736 [Streptomyces turgidiscabies]|uniref:Uncharacterized protein n=1 Tax=Streptomyces turgidiscabies TaxID=85558 RepID=A0ABU0RIQ4_9ACTN|nr:hypothetical protein [Streptomyces turgidiscabies]
MAPTRLSPTFAAGKSATAPRDWIWSRPVFCAVYEPYTAPPRRLTCSCGFTVTHSSVNGSVAVTTRTFLTWTFMPSRDS